MVLSFLATLGVCALVLDKVFGFAGADLSFPLFSFVFLVALGIDYNIFLMTRGREEARLHGTRKGTLTGLTVTGGVITSAGVVLAATFSALAVRPAPVGGGQSIVSVSDADGNAIVLVAPRRRLTSSEQLSLRTGKE